MLSQNSYQIHYLHHQNLRIDQTFLGHVYHTADNLNRSNISTP